MKNIINDEAYLKDKYKEFITEVDPGSTKSYEEWKQGFINGLEAQSEKEVIKLIQDKIREAEQCEDSEISEEYLTGYINGLKMALTCIEEQGLCS